MTLPTARPRWRQWALGPLPLLLLALLPVAWYFSTGMNALGGRLGLPLDDSYIHLQFARNLARGEGLSYNPGELVTASTAPLWTALLSLFFRLPGNPLAWTLFLGVALHLGVVDASRRFARELGLGPGLAALAALLTLATYWLVWSSLAGMEVPLFTLLSLWGMILHLRERRRPRRPVLALGVLGLAALARPEGLLLLALAMADGLVPLSRAAAGLRLGPPPWRRLAGGLALAALALAPALVFYQAVGGSPLPTTFAAKAAAGRSWLPDPRYLHLVLGILFKPQPFTTLLAAAGMVRLAEGLGGQRDRGLLPALWVVGLPLVYSTLSPPGKALVGNFGRYFFPLYPVVIALGLLGVERAATALGPWWRAGRHRLPAAAVLAIVLLWPTASTLLANAGFYAANLADVEVSDVRLGRWVRRHVPPEAVLAVQDVGAVKFLAPNRVIDLSGLVSPELVAMVRAAASPRDPRGDLGVLRFVEARRPDLLAAFPARRPALTADHSRFRPILRLPVPGNITMAGDELVLYATPWNRFPLPGPSPPGP
jgi:hypothetical protein